MFLSPPGEPQGVPNGRQPPTDLMSTSPNGKQLTPNIPAAEWTPERSAYRHAKQLPPRCMQFASIESSRLAASSGNSTFADFADTFGAILARLTPSSSSFAYIHRIAYLFSDRGLYRELTLLRLRSAHGVLRKANWMGFRSANRQVCRARCSVPVAGQTSMSSTFPTRPSSY